MHHAKKIGRILDSHFRKRKRSFFPRIRWRKQQEEESSDYHFLRGLASGKVHIIEGDIQRPVRWRLPGMPLSKMLRSAPAALSGRIRGMFRRSAAGRPDVRTLLDAASRVIDQISAPEFERIKRSTEYARYQELRKRYYGHQ